MFGWDKGPSAPQILRAIFQTVIVTEISGAEIHKHHSSGGLLSIFVSLWGVGDAPRASLTSSPAVKNHHLTHTHIDSYCFYTELIISWPKQKPYSILHCHNNRTEYVYLGVWFVGRVGISGETETHTLYTHSKVSMTWWMEFFSLMLPLIILNNVIHKFFFKSLVIHWFFWSVYNLYMVPELLYGYLLIKKIFRSTWFLGYLQHKFIDGFLLDLKKT